MHLPAGFAYAIFLCTFHDAAGLQMGDRPFFHKRQRQVAPRANDASFRTKTDGQVTPTANEENSRTKKGQRQVTPTANEESSRIKKGKRHVTARANEASSRKKKGGRHVTPRANEESSRTKKGKRHVTPRANEESSRTKKGKRHVTPRANEASSRTKKGHRQVTPRANEASSRTKKGQRHVTPRANETSSRSKKLWEDLDVAEKRSLWWELTEDLQRSQGWPIVEKDLMWPKGPGERALLDEWNQHIGAELTNAHLDDHQRKLRCAETGDGHFLKAAFAEVCGATLVVDLYDTAADVQMDLNQLPSEAPKRVKDSMNTMDVVVSHMTLEHLKRPSVGIANLNALLKVGGFLVLSTPFVAPDHWGPGDDFLRWTVRGLHKLVECAGFKVQQLRGLGDRLEEIAYLAGVREDMMDASHLGVGCDGLADNDCALQNFAAVAAFGTKKEDKTVEDIHNCFG